jgi:hypothetical protein
MAKNFIMGIGKDNATFTMYAIEASQKFIHEYKINRPWLTLESKDYDDLFVAHMSWLIDSDSDEARAEIHNVLLHHESILNMLSKLTILLSSAGTWIKQLSDKLGYGDSVFETLCGNFKETIDAANELWANEVAK